MFSEEAAIKLPEHGPYDIAIKLVDGKVLPFGPLYNLSKSKLEVL